MPALYYVSGVVIALTIAALAWTNNDTQAPVPVLFLAFGAIGAVVREHVDLRIGPPVERSPTLTAIVCFSPVMGALLALVLMAFFLSGLVGGELFPKFLNTDKNFESARAVLRGDVTLASNSDFYKMIAWSIVAGYSEKFVLSKLEALTRSTKPKR